ncbi:MAG: peptidase C14 [Acidimicrobiales bacterium]|nr:MAG: peptidase C14 [Acidimicrobiales bacterium]
MGRYALLLGTSIFHDDSTLKPLPMVRNDIGQLKALLDAAGNFERVDTHLDLGREKLTSALEEFFGDRRVGDLALLYYSGHGLMDERDRESVFLAATDTRHEQLHASAVDSDGVLRHLLNITRASQKVVLLDCCFSGAFGARNRFSGGVRQEPRRGVRQHGTFVLTSSNHARASKTQGNDRPSVFTDAVLTGLRGAATALNGESWITTNDLTRYVQGQLARDPHRRPVESSEGVTEPIKLVTIEPSVGVVSGKKTPLQGADSDLDADYWRRLLRYYVSCMERSAVLGSFIDVKARQTYQAVPAGPDQVFVGEVSERNGFAAIAALGQRMVAEGRQLRYGYPVLVQRTTGQRSGPQCAPLLISDVTLTPDGGLLPTLPPQLNRALAQKLGLGDVEIDDLIQQVEETFVAGDPDTLGETVRDLMEVLGVAAAVPIDPTELSGTVNTGPLNRVQNTAVLYGVDVGETAQCMLIKDLRDLIAADPKKITTSALGTLAGRSVGDDSSAEPMTSKPVTIVAPDRLNEAQEQIIQAAMSRRLTVAQGPPGTGKSQLVTALVATATAAGQTVLVGSTNNKAVDEVTDRITAEVGPGLLVRTGNQHYRAQEPSLLASLLTAHAGGPPGDERTAEAELRLVQQEITQLRCVLDDQRLIERDLAELVTERVLEDRDELELPAEETKLVSLANLAQRATAGGVFSWWWRWRLGWRLRAFHLADRAAIEEFTHRVTVELRWRSGRRRLEKLPDDYATWSRLVELVTVKRPKYSRELLRIQLANRIRKGVDMLRFRCDQMSKAPPSTWNKFRELLGTLPAWATSAMSARALVPQPALFDLVIIDEAAQCTIPAILPMLYRARRALIIGDPRQLTPVITLPKQEETQRKSEAGLSSDWLESRRLTYTRHSGYDAFAAVSDRIHLLDEHYRCHPDIIAGPNRAVYQGRLTVLTDPARLAAPTEPAARWHHVGGAFTHGDQSSGSNQPELIAVVTEVQRLLMEYPGVSIGVVTPLSNQRRQLARALAAVGVLETEVMCGTIHQFQGSEQDIMVISPVGAHGVRDNTRNWLVHQTHLWNVAITRARSQLVVVGDRQWWASQQGLLTELARESNNSDAEITAPYAAADRLHAALQRSGLNVERDAVMAGRRYDIVASGSAARAALLIDDPQGDRDGKKLRKVLAWIDIATASTTVHRIPAWRCYAEPDLVIAELSLEGLPAAARR